MDPIVKKQIAVLVSRIILVALAVGIIWIPELFIALVAIFFTLIVTGYIMRRQ